MACPSYIDGSNRQVLTASMALASRLFSSVRSTFTSATLPSGCTVSERITLPRSRFFRAYSEYSGFGEYVALGAVLQSGRGSLMGQVGVSGGGCWAWSVGAITKTQVRAASARRIVLTSQPENCGTRKRAAQPHSYG